LVAGAGVLGLWQALVLARAGVRVRVVERDPVLFATAASRYAGAMLSPYCEAEAADPHLVDLGIAGLRRWQETLPDQITSAGTLVVAAPRDRSEVLRFAKLTRGHTRLFPQAIATLEPDLGERFPAALYYADEAHMDPLRSLQALADAVRETGGTIETGVAFDPLSPGADDQIVIDCRGFSARDRCVDLRGVRGERVVVRAPDVRLSRMVRLLHPRQPLYVVPWLDHHFMIGATVIESADDGPVTVRSALDLLAAAFAVHPGFAEARIVDFGAGVRPAFPSNMPEIRIREGSGRLIHINGAYRHGFLLAPVLADAVLAYLADGSRHPVLMPNETAAQPEPAPRGNET
jgi:glycine oxidase